MCRYAREGCPAAWSQETAPKDKGTALTPTVRLPPHQQPTWPRINYIRIIKNQSRGFLHTPMSEQMQKHAAWSLTCSKGFLFIAPNQIWLPPMVIHHPLWVIKGISEGNSNKASAKGLSNARTASQGGACWRWAHIPGTSLHTHDTSCFSRVMVLQTPHSPCFTPCSSSWRVGPSKIPVRQLTSLFHNQIFRKSEVSSFSWRCLN